MFRKRKELKNKKGFTLVELIISLGVFSAGIMSAFTLALAGLNTSKDNYARLQAANLAREGLELVRNERDSNWLKIDANQDCDPDDGISICIWNNNLTPGYYFADFFYRVEEQEDLDENHFANLGSCGVCSIYYDDSHPNAENKQFFSMTNHSGVRTNMKRLIEIKNICFDGINEEVTEDNCGEDETIGLEVISRVYWQLLGKEHQIDVKEKLYNWKRW